MVDDIEVVQIGESGLEVRNGHRIFSMPVYTCRRDAVLVVVCYSVQSSCVALQPISIRVSAAASVATLQWYTQQARLLVVHLVNLT